MLCWWVVTVATTYNSLLVCLDQTSVHVVNDLIHLCRGRLHTSAPQGNYQHSEIKSRCAWAGERMRLIFSWAVVLVLNHDVWPLRLTQLGEGKLKSVGFGCKVVNKRYCTCHLHCSIHTASDLAYLKHVFWAIFSESEIVYIQGHTTWPHCGTIWPY